MKTTQMLLLSAAAVLLTSCSGKLGALSADNFKVTPNPLETQAGEVSATINGMFPEKYMKKKAVVTVTPQLRFQTPQGLKSVNGEGATFQGEKVLGNDQTISYLVGGNYTMKTNFAYTPEMQQSDMYLIFDAKVGKKTVKVPEVKVATGIIATSELYKRTLTSANPALAEDAFQRISEQKQQANIKFLIGQAQLRKSELQNNSVQEFVRLINKIVADQEGMALDNIEVSAYASPDGGYALNEKLANKRQDVTNDYLKKEMKKAKMDAPVDTKYTAEDWEGFQELVAASDIQDKDVILRVLSMYKDPEEREQQIKNISAAFRELTDGILPQLRRSRLTINYLLIGRDDEQILAQMKSDATQLSIEEILYGATLYDDDLASTEAAYKKAVELYKNDPRAYNNLARLAYAKGNYSEAKQWLDKAAAIDRNQAETNANLGLLALQQGDMLSAESYIAKASNANGLNEVLGNLHLAQGKYAQAEQDFGRVQSNSAALAQILNNNYQAAASTLKNVKNADATTDYLRAILNARTGKTADAAAALKQAIAKDPSLADYAAKDLELTKVSK
ncbi:tetratricopeptide repeat protein [Prevotella communis]|jgi:tetratricopeptide (TPR) repeat protein|uniref:tetratricopeptide repeat protein n=1 Tax=Prevotella communis TaxID=2913614 RepID=UPI001EDBE539|nr:tetratricopeptide repeat protein [Prevotella communis]UKK59852.1 tetratricopeptide repeat protein [Prevotella communis]UKK67847.1 tetratricopeptide repeat protein [Prevotella communis]UKK70018.1 tetratricopeptide repeat protein [Prevotella communis]